MAHSNISIFVTHVGCPHLCAFCDQRTITGSADLPSGEDVRRICERALHEVSDPADTEIAFFGGSFTAIERSYMTELLSAAHEFVGEGKFKGIRLSTRPDYIDREVLDILRSYGVTAIELGAQSLDDRVLEANERGHSAEDIVNAASLIKEYGFELGLQLMVGLYKSDESIERENLRKALEIAPSAVRIYPVVILKGTKLAELYLSGEYVTMDFDTVVSVCADMLCEFEKAGIKVLKCGLHASEFVERYMAGGFYHPAFKELCEAEIYRRRIESTIFCTDISGKRKVTIAVNPSCISKALGQKRANYEYFKRLGIELKITGDKSIPKYEIKEVRACT